MKLKSLFIFFILFINLAFSQNKKELENKLIGIENEISNIKLNLINTNSILAQVSKSNLDLEKLVREQSDIIYKLSKQNDSLLIAYKIKNEPYLIKNPNNQKDSIIYLIQSYLASENLEKRLNFVLHPEIVKSKMQKHYSGFYRQIKIKKENIFLQEYDLIDNNLIKVNIDGSNIFYVKKIKNEFKIDWEASIGFNTISLRTFRANLGNEPTEFRVYASISNYYNYNYKNSQSNYWSVEISNDENIFGYVAKNSAEGKKIYEILKDGKIHQLILEVKIDATQDHSGDTAIITKFVKDGWSKE